MKNFLIFSFLIFLASCEPLSRVRDSVPPTVLSSEIQTNEPFFAELYLTLSSSEVTVNEVYFEVIPKRDYRAKSISAAYSKEGGRFQQIGDKLFIPIFGLYQDFKNIVRLRVSFDGYTQLAGYTQDGYTQSAGYTQKIKTPRYKGNDESFWDPKIKKISSPTRELGFSYFLLESNANKRHVVMDIDGELRWALPLSEVKKRQSNLFRSDGRHTFGSLWFDPENASFVLQRDNKLYFSPITSANPPGADQTFVINAHGLSNIFPHHDMNKGKQGYLLNINAVKNGEKRFESIVLEVNSRGEVIKQWDFGDILTKYMKENGESDQKIGRFIRHGSDWLHINSTIYSPDDNTIIVSGRENFVIKVGYNDKKIRWIFGDPEKHWYVNYAQSLRKAALTVNGSGKPPIGQHSLSLIEFNGEKALLLFNNGKRSIEQLADVPAGRDLIYSLVQAWKIDEAGKTAELLWKYDAGIFSDFCSSVYQAGTDYLVTYSRVLVSGNTYKVVTRGINQNKKTLFQMESNGRCSIWNSKIINLHDLRI